MMGAMRPDSRFSTDVLGETILRALETSRIGVAVVAATADGGIERVFSNQPLADILGVSLDELRAMPVSLPVAPEEREAVESMRAAWARGEKVPTSFRTVILTPTGRRVTIDVTVAITRVQDRPMSVSFIRDLTESLQMEEALRRSEARFRHLADGAPDGITVHVRGRLVYANEAILRMAGESSFEGLARKGILERLSDADRAAMIDRLAQVSAGAVLGPREYEVGDFGSVGSVEVHSIAFEFDGQAAVLSFVRDVTDRRRMLEDLRRADRLAALGTMAAAVAHEVNNPLTYVLLHLGELQSLLPSLLPGREATEAGRMIAEALEGAERVRIIVRDLLSFARADPGSRQAVSAVQPLESAIKLAGNVLRHRASIVRDFAEVPPVSASHARLEQVFLNLLVNAAQAIPDERAGRGVIRLATRPDGEDHVVVEVADDGAGIPPAHLPHVFEPFFTTKPEGIGTGLGLAISRTIVDSLGGEISVHCPPEGGTTVRVRLPTARPDQLPEPVAPPRARSAAAPRGRGRLLIVDDEVRLANLLLALIGERHEVRVATSAAEALATLRTGENFDVVLCDLMMPEMTGMDLYEVVGRERPELTSRFVFLTGGAFTERASAFVARSDVSTILKPFDLLELEDAIQARLGR